MQKITIKNFGPIKDLELEINDYLLLIGEQATGKSTIAKLIYFFKSIRHDLIAYLYDETELKQGVKDDFNYKIADRFSSFFGSVKLMSSFFVRFHYGNGISFTTQKKQKGKVLATFLGRDEYLSTNKMLPDIEEFRNKYFKQKSALISTSKRRAIEFEKSNEIKNFETRINEILGDDRDTLFIPAGRSILSTLSEQIQTIDIYNLDFLMKEFLKRIQRLKSAFGQSLDEIIQDAKDTSTPLPSQEAIDLAVLRINEILKGRYHFDTFGEKIYFNDKDFVKLNFASSGQQEAIWILLQIFTLLINKERIFLVIEEPEAHLYPVAQKKMVELIALLINQTDSKVIITTHSPYILSSFNNLIYAGKVGKNCKEETAKIVDPLIWVPSNKVTAKKLSQEGVTDLIDEELGLIKVEEIDSASKIINEEFDHLFNLDDE